MCFTHSEIPVVPQLPSKMRKVEAASTTEVDVSENSVEKLAAASTTVVNASENSVEKVEPQEPQVDSKGIE